MVILDTCSLLNFPDVPDSSSPGGPQLQHEEGPGGRQTSSLDSRAEMMLNANQALKSAFYTVYHMLSNGFISWFLHETFCGG